MFLERSQLCPCKSGCGRRSLESLRLQLSCSKIIGIQPGRGLHVFMLSSIAGVNTGF